jgi:dolichyl-phosphate-mannose--protein O-mannosyl transferase
MARMSTTSAWVDATTPLPSYDASTLERIRGRLIRPLPDDRLAGWLLPLAITVLAGLLRFWRITRPSGATLHSSSGIVFDETYYAHDSWELLHHGVETNGLGTGAGFVVHPPLGKWAMAVGEALFDHGKTVTFHHTVYPASPLSFRFMGAVVGTLAVLMVCRIGRRMFHSTAIGCIAGILVTLDGLEFVQSRTAMLDIYLMFWVLAAFGCLVLDRDDGRRRLAEKLQAPLDMDGTGPRLGLRPWRVAAGVCLGAACATKWDGAYFVPALLVLAVFWDAQARRTAGSRSGLAAAMTVDAAPALVQLIVLPAVVYVASWTGWFLSNGTLAYDHDRYIHPGQSWLAHDWSVFRGWLQYQREIWHYDASLNWIKNPHPYLSRPYGWLLLTRPVAYYYEAPKGCGAATCSQEVLGVGNPLLWWASIPALLAMAWAWLARRDWRAGGILLVFLAGYLPWFYEDTKQRVMFLFYMLPDVPFMALAVAMGLGMLIGHRRISELRRSIGVAVAGAYLAAALAMFAFLYPILGGQLITYAQWHERILPPYRHCQVKPDKHQENAPCWI